MPISWEMDSIKRKCKNINIFNKFNIVKNKIVYGNGEYIVYKTEDLKNDLDIILLGLNNQFYLHCNIYYRNNYLGIFRQKDKIINDENELNYYLLNIDSDSKGKNQIFGKYEIVKQEQGYLSKGNRNIFGWFNTVKTPFVAQTKFESFRDETYNYIKKIYEKIPYIENQEMYIDNFIYKKDAKTNFWFITFFTTYFIKEYTDNFKSRFESFFDIPEIKNKSELQKYLPTEKAVEYYYILTNLPTFGIYENNSINHRGKEYVLCTKNNFIELINNLYHACTTFYDDIYDLVILQCDKGLEEMSNTVNEVINKNANLVRISVEKANKDRNITPRKADGFVLLKSQCLYKPDDFGTKIIWTHIIQTPFPVTFPFNCIERRVRFSLCEKYRLNFTKGYNENHISEISFNKSSFKGYWEVKIKTATEISDNVIK